MVRQKRENKYELLNVFLEKLFEKYLPTFLPAFIL
jgi:hypothetical protein